MNGYGQGDISEDIRSGADAGPRCSEIDHVCDTREAARQEVFEYIELFCNPKRKHTTNGLLSPADFEIRQQKLNEAGV
jgi:Integrase core domain